MSGMLYQLRYAFKPAIGSEVDINGPYDTFGFPVKDLEDFDKNKGGHLMLVRGTGRNRGGVRGRLF